MLVFGSVRTSADAMRFASTELSQPSSSPALIRSQPCYITSSLMLSNLAPSDSFVNTTKDAQKAWTNVAV